MALNKLEDQQKVINNNSSEKEEKITLENSRRSLDNKIRM